VIGCRAGCLPVRRVYVLSLCQVPHGLTRAGRGPWRARRRAEPPLRHARLLRRAASCPPPGSVRRMGQGLLSSHSRMPFPAQAEGLDPDAAERTEEPAEAADRVDACSFLAAGGGEARFGAALALHAVLCGAGCARSLESGLAGDAAPRAPGGAAAAPGAAAAESAPSGEPPAGVAADGNAAPAAATARGELPGGEVPNRGGARAGPASGGPGRAPLGRAAAAVALLLEAAGERRVRALLRPGRQLTRACRAAGKLAECIACVWCAHGRAAPRAMWVNMLHSSGLVWPARLLAWVAAAATVAPWTELGCLRRAAAAAAWREATLQGLPTECERPHGSERLCAVPCCTYPSPTLALAYRGFPPRPACSRRRWRARRWRWRPRRRPRAAAARRRLPPRTRCYACWRPRRKPTLWPRCAMRPSSRWTPC